MSFHVADEAYLASLTTLDGKIFLEDSDEYPLFWMAGGEALLLASLGLDEFEGVSVFDFASLLERSQEKAAEIVFLTDPAPKFAWLANLDRDPGVEINSDLPETKWGFFPHQIQAINFLKECSFGGYANHSTGTGKTAVAEGIILWRKQVGMDLCLYVVKPNNLTGAQRKLEAHTGLESIILPRARKTRRKTIEKVDAMVAAGEQPILIMNAEKLREDKEWFKILVQDREVLLILDEVPTRYANRTTQIYKSTCEVFYDSYIIPTHGKSKGRRVYYPRAGFERAKLFGLELSATPILNSPEDEFNSLRIIDPGSMGSIDTFMKDHAGPRDYWGNILSWRDLPQFRAKISHLVHVVDKDHPQIAKYFPKKLPPEIAYCDLDLNSEMLYNKLMDQFDFEAIFSGASIISRTEILSAIQVFQMICSNPRSILLSSDWRRDYNTYLLEDTGKPVRGNAVALKLRELIGDDSKFTDQDKKGNCTVSKMLELKHRLENHHDKAIVFTDRNELLLPYMQEWFDKWGFTYVTYTGSEQRNIDQFRQDDSIQVFLSTDAGSDSIDLPEASLTVNYDIPWTWARIVQRFNRQDRIDSLKEVLQMVTLLCPFTFEERKLEIVQTKKDYGDKVNTATLLYMLSGLQPE